MQKYVLFNPINGVHETVDTIEEAKQKQRDLMNAFIQTNIVPMFSCNVETINEDGSKTWVAFDLKLEKEVPSILKQIIKTSIVEYFGAGTLIDYEIVRQVLIEEGLIKEDQVYDIEPGKTN